MHVSKVVLTNEKLFQKSDQMIKNSTREQLQVSFNRIPNQELEPALTWICITDETKSKNTFSIVVSVSFEQDYTILF
jgi:hypothetical protein